MPFNFHYFLLRTYSLYCAVIFFSLTYSLNSQISGHINLNILGLTSLGVGCYYYFLQNSKWLNHTIFSIIIIILSITLTTLTSINNILFLIVIALALLYHSKFVKIRNRIILKNSTIALCWILLICSLISFNVWLDHNFTLLLNSFLLLYLLSTLSDKLDYHLDISTGHVTLATDSNKKILLMYQFSILTIWTISMFYYYSNSTNSIILLFIIILLSYYIVFFNPNNDSVRMIKHKYFLDSSLLAYSLFLILK